MMSSLRVIMLWLTKYNTCSVFICLKTKYIFFVKNSQKSKRTLYTLFSKRNKPNLFYSSKSHQYTILNDFFPLWWHIF
jgi:hypothetical protein